MRAANIPISPEPMSVIASTAGLSFPAFFGTYNFKSPMTDRASPPRNPSSAAVMSGSIHNHLLFLMSASSLLDY